MDVKKIARAIEADVGEPLPDLLKTLPNGSKHDGAVHR